MPLWLISQKAPWRRPRENAYSNRHIINILIRAPTEKRARALASAHGIPIPVSDAGKSVPEIDTPFLHSTESTCAEIDPNGPEGVIFSQRLTNP